MKRCWLIDMAIPQPPFTIIIDTRENKPYLFASITPRPATVFKALETGDYSIEGHEGAGGITIERKTLQDAYGTFGAGRKRFERELDRMSSYKTSVVIIEADWDTILRRPPVHSVFSPRSFLASVVAWQQRYKVHFWACGNRSLGEKCAYRILERFWKDHQ